MGVPSLDVTAQMQGNAPPPARRQSSPVSTATTPSTASAGFGSIERMTAWACWLRMKTACNAWGSRRSST